jgi:hypothetical protein
MSVQVTNSLTGNISVTDNQTGSIAQILALSQSYVGSVSEYYPAFSVTTGGSAVTFPIAALQFVYVKNTSTTATITVVATPNGGSSATVIKLDPGGFWMFGETTITNGITAMTLTSSSGTITAQLILAG